MPTTKDVLDQHLRCFGENDLDNPETLRVVVQHIHAVDASE